MGVGGGEFLVEKFEVLEIWAQKFEVPSAIPLGGPTPQGGLPAGPQRARGGLAKPLDTLDNPVIPRGLGWLRICMDDRYARAGQGGVKALGMRTILMGTWLSHTSPPKLSPVAILKGQHGHRGQDCRSQLHINNMFTTYSESVLDFTDHAGNLSHGDAAKLLADHGCCLDDVYADNHGVSWLHLDARNAEALLAWLGY